MPTAPKRITPTDDNNQNTKKEPSPRRRVVDDITCTISSDDAVVDKAPVKRAPKKDKAAPVKDMFDITSEYLGVSRQDLLDTLPRNPHRILYRHISGEEIWIPTIPSHKVLGPPGVRPARVLVVTNKPYPEDANNSKLFSSTMGNLWKGMLDHNKIDYSDWLVTSVCGQVNPDWLKVTSAMQKLWAPILNNTFDSAQPEVVIAFGSDALQAVFDMSSANGPAPKAKIKDFRGAIVDLVVRGLPIKLVACTHPSAIKADPSQEESFYRDMETVMDAVTGRDRDIKVSPNEIIHEIGNIGDLTAMVDRLVSEDHIRFAVDCEWGNGSWKSGLLRTVQIAWSEDEVMVIALRGENLAPRFGHDEVQAYAEMARLLKRPGTIIDGHNVRGDLHWLRDRGVDLMPEFLENGFDTMLVAHLLDEHDELQIELCGNRYLNTGRYDLELRRWISDNGISKKRIDVEGYGMIPDAVLIPYAGRDALLTWRLGTKLRKELAQYPGLVVLYDECVRPANEGLYEMESTGAAVDEDRMTVLIGLFAEHLERMLERIRVDLNWPTFNPRSVDHKREALFGYQKTKNGQLIRVAPEGAVYLNLEPLRSTKNKSWCKVIEEGRSAFEPPSTDGATLGALVNSSPIVARIKTYMHIASVRSNLLVEPDIDTDTGEVCYESGMGKTVYDGRLFTTYRQWLETGRYSSSPNAQAYPKKQEAEFQRAFKDAAGVIDPRYVPIRTIFVASPGHVLIEADWNQAELWTLGHLSGDDDYLDVLSKSDLHCEMMRECFPDVLFKDKRLWDYTALEIKKFYKTDKDMEFRRTCTKAVNFGINYGIGPAGIVTGIKKEGGDCTEEQAALWISRFYSRFKRIDDYGKRLRYMVVDPGYLENPFGRIRRFPSTEDRALISSYEREALNWPIQSTVADAMSRSLALLCGYRRCVDTSVLFKMLFSTHDAILFEVPIPHVENFTQNVLPVCMEKALVVPSYGPIYKLGDIDIQLRWGETPPPQTLSDLGIPKHLCGFK